MASAGAATDQSILALVSTSLHEERNNFATSESHHYYNHNLLQPWLTLHFAPYVTKENFLKPTGLLTTP